MSEILVGAAEATGHALEMSPTFIGIVVLAVVGGAAESAAAIAMARKNQMDLSVGIAMGSCIQIALFVTPVLVLSSALIAPERLTLEFSRLEMGALFLGVLIGAQVAGDGHSNWYKGVLLFAFYLDPRGDVLSDSRVSGLALAPGRFHLLLLSLLLFFGGTAAAAGSRAERVVEVSLLALIIVAAVLDLRERGHQRNLAIALAGGVIFVSAANLSARIKHLPAVSGALIVLFAGLVVWRAYTAVMRRQRSVRDRIAGAICVYVLIGLAWAKVYETLDDVVPGAFRFPAGHGVGHTELRAL